MISKLKLVTAVIIGILITAETFCQPKYSSESLLSSKLEGKYVGGMQKFIPNYPFVMPEFDYKVRTKEEFLAALKSIRSYGVIYIEGDVEIDLTDEGTVSVRTGVKLISDRGNNGSLGARILSRNPRSFPMFECGSYVSFIGLRIDGTDNDIYFNNVKRATFKENTYGPGVTQGIRTHRKGLTILNCELSGWTHSAVLIKGGSGKIMYSYIHHNRRSGLGYGVTVDGGEATIEGNLFDYNRHSIASTGVENSSYTVINNIFLENGTSHVVDVHGGKDRRENNDIAGKHFVVKGNWFRLNQDSGGAFVIRGVPTQKAEFIDNVIEILNPRSRVKNQNVSRYIKQNNRKGNFESRNNVLR